MKGDKCEIELLREENRHLRTLLSQTTQDRSFTKEKEALESTAGYSEETNRASQPENQTANEYEQLLAMLDDTPMGLYIIDNEFRFAHINSVALPIFCHFDPLIGRDFTDMLQSLWLPEVAKEIEQCFRRTLTTGEPYDAPSFSNQRDDRGVEESYDWHLRPFVSANGDPAVICYFNDITEKKRTQLNRDLMLEINQDLARTWDENELLLVIGERIGRHFAANHVTFTEVNHDASSLHIFFEWLGSKDTPPSIGKYPLSQYVTVEMQHGFLAGKPQVVDDVRSHPSSKDVVSVMQNAKFGSCIRAPYVSDGIWKFSIAVNRKEGSVWRPDEVQLMTELSSRVWSGVERARALKLLRKSDGDFRQLAEALPQIIWVTDVEGKLSYANQKWHEFSGLNIEQTQDLILIGELYHPDDRELVANAWKEAFSQVTPFEIEARMRDQHGSYHWFLIRAINILDADGKLCNWFGTSTDITKHKEADERLRKSEERFRIAENASKSFVYEWDMVSGLEQRSEGFTKSLGYLQGEHPFGGAAWEELIHPEDLAHVRAATNQVITSATGVASVEYRIRHKNGSWIWSFDEFTAIRDKHGIVCRVIGMILDISARKQAEDEIKELNGRLHRAVYESHHRIKNNLQVLSALVEIQAATDEKSIPASALHRIGQHIRNLATLHDLLTIDTKNALEQGVVSLKAILEKLTPMFIATSGGRNIKVQALDILVTLKQANAFSLLINELITNSIKHGKTETKINLSLLPADETFHESKIPSALLEVYDDGPGFPQNFDPKKSANTGLELIESLSRWDLRGEVFYENPKSGGGLVRVVFPIQMLDGK